MSVNTVLAPWTWITTTLASRRNLPVKISPPASSSLVTKVWKGLNALYKISLIERPKTRVYCAQAEGCAPIVAAIKEGSEVIKPVKPQAIAKSLAIGNPADGSYATRNQR